MGYFFLKCPINDGVKTLPAFEIPRRNYHFSTNKPGKNKDFSLKSFRENNVCGQNTYIVNSSRVVTSEISKLVVALGQEGSPSVRV